MTFPEDKQLLIHHPLHVTLRQVLVTLLSEWKRKMRIAHVTRQQIVPFLYSAHRVLLPLCRALTLWQRHYFDLFTGSSSNNFPAQMRPMPIAYSQYWAPPAPSTEQYQNSLPEPLTVHCSHTFRKQNTFLDSYPTVHIQYTAWPKITNKKRGCTNLFYLEGQREEIKRVWKELLILPALSAAKIHSKCWEGMLQKSCLLYGNMEFTVKTRLAGLN